MTDAIRFNQPVTTGAPLVAAGVPAELRQKEERFDDGVSLGDRTSGYGGYSRDYARKADSAAEVRESYGRKAEAAGYDENFLGADAPVPYPKLTGAAQESALVVGGDGDTQIRHTHFSITMNRERKMAAVTADNIDGPTLIEDIGRDKWMPDPSIGVEFQQGDGIYSHNVLDRGHMVRRRDVVWGDRNEAKKGNQETFYYTNAVPQHAMLNQKKWNDLENWLLQRAEIGKQRLCVFTGPVFSDDDVKYRKEKIPGEFYKIVVLRRKSDNKVAAAGFMMSQKDLLRNIDKQKPKSNSPVGGEIVPTEAVAPFQVTIDQIEKLTGLDFGNIKDVDAFALFQEEKKVASESRGAASFITTLSGEGDLSVPMGPHTINSPEDIII